MRSAAAAAVGAVGGPCSASVLCWVECWSRRGAGACGRHVPLIRPEAGIGGRQHVLHLGAQLVELHGEAGEAVIQLIVGRHGA